jgi:hypothetical protein
MLLYHGARSNNQFDQKTGGMGLEREGLEIEGLEGERFEKGFQEIILSF